MRNNTEIRLVIEFAVADAARFTEMAEAMVGSELSDMFPPPLVLDLPASDSAHSIGYFPNPNAPL